MDATTKSGSFTAPSGRGAVALREAGFDAKYMKGGHSGCRATGGPVKTYA